MNASHLDDMFRGWYIGNFEPSLLKTSDFEVGVKRYGAGEREDRHHHKIATEYTTIAVGRVLMNGKVYEEGSIVVVAAGESTDFQALTDAITVVVKVPCVPNDKFID